MVNFRNWGTQYSPSGAYGRNNVNQRYQQRAYNAAMQARTYYPTMPSIMMTPMPQYQSTSVEYDASPSKGFIWGAFASQTLTAVAQNWEGLKNLGSTIAGWFKKS